MTGFLRLKTTRRLFSHQRLERDGEAGFTLVEMLVVITIIAMIMALVAPRVSGWSPNPLGHALSRLDVLPPG